MQNQPNSYFASLFSFEQCVFIECHTVNRFLNASDEGRESQRNNSDNIVKERDKVNSFGFNGTIYSEPFSFWKVNSGFEVYHVQVGSRRHTENCVTGESVNQRALYPDGSNGTIRVYLHCIHFD